MVTQNQPLIPVKEGVIGGVKTLVVDARELHAFLKVGKDFTNWIKGRIRQYGFELDRDYLLAKTGEQLPSGTKWRDEYLLTIDMAKELAMVERNEAGRQVRRYFLECKKRLRYIEEAVAQLQWERLNLVWQTIKRDWGMVN